MRFQSALTVISAVAVGHVAAETGALGDAIVVKNNPPAPIYKASLPADPFFKTGSLNGNVRGSITAVGTLSGEGVQFKVRFENLPKEGGPFMYHIHVDPVPSNGNCTATLAHHDPFVRGEATPCDASKHETCQVGDLSGKWGNVTSDPFEMTYTDPYAALVPGIGSNFGNRSFVFHFGNKTRISCANFQVVSGTELSPSDTCNGTAPSGTGSPLSPTTTPTTGPRITNAASAASFSLVALVGAVGALFFSL